MTFRRMAQTPTPQNKPLVDDVPQTIECSELVASRSTHGNNDAMSRRDIDAGILHEQLLFETPLAAIFSSKIMITPFLTYFLSNAKSRRVS
jgi:hypothetical protein